MNRLFHILVVDDEERIRTSLARALKLEGYTSNSAASIAEGKSTLAKDEVDLVLLDICLHNENGLELLRWIKLHHSNVPVLVMSGHGDIRTAVSAVTSGAHDYLEKPIETDRLLLSIQRALEHRLLKEENETLQGQLGGSNLLGASVPMLQLQAQIKRVAPASAPVLILGERGTGKELVAQAIHTHSKRKSGPYEKLNCAAVPDNLIESELFGHVAGAFTGATQNRRGKFERANGGTLFLDEVGDMPLTMQAKLLRVLQESEVEPLGGSKTIGIDVRIIAATNKDLTEEVRNNRFRADLFDRINVVPLRLPTLAARKEDIPVLVEHLLTAACNRNHCTRKTISPKAMEYLENHTYPGNVRELQNLVERLVILTPGHTIEIENVKEFLPGFSGHSVGEYVPGQSLKSMLEAAERHLISEALHHQNGNVSQTARELNVERSHLYKKMRALGIHQGRDTSS